MHTFLYHFQQDGKHLSQIAIHQEEIIREENGWIKIHFLYPL